MAELRKIKMSDIEICRERYRSDRLLDVKAVPECLLTMNEEGLWEDLIYDGKSSSRAYRHPSRLLEIAKAIYNPENPLYNSREAIEKLELGINAWLARDISFTDNWWYNSVGVPTDFADLMMAAGHLLSPETEKKACAYLKNKIEINESTAKNSVGTNVYTREKTRLGYSLYARDKDRIREVFDIVSKGIKMVTKQGEESDSKKRIWNSYVKLDHLPDTKEGLQADYSYLLHGPMFLPGSYGKELVNSLASFLNYANGTELFPLSDLTDYSDMILELYRWIVRNNVLDYSGLGRAITTKSVFETERSAVPFYGGLKVLASLNILPRQKEIAEFYSNVQKGIPPVTGNRYFWKADYTAHPQRDFLLTVRTSSNRTVASEQVNTENLLCDFLGDGVTYIYRDGGEYDSVFPVWDWHKIPGTTALNRKFEPPMIQHRAVRGSESDCVGGVSDGSIGASAMELSRYGLKAKKAWFMFGDCFAALGAGIKCDSDAGHMTTVNQCLLRSPVTVCRGEGEREILEPATEHCINASWVHHDNIGYFVKGDVKIGVEPKKQGDRRNINLRGAYTPPETPEPVEKDIFTLWYDHSGRAEDRYEYIVLPEIDADSMERANPYSYIKILANSESLQAVENTRLKSVQGVFWQENEVMRSEGGLSASADCKVLLQLCEREDGTELAVSSLCAEERIVNIRINRALSGDGVTESGGESIVSVALPGGEYRGASVKRFLAYSK